MAIFRLYIKVLLKIVKEDCTNLYKWNKKYQKCIKTVKYNKRVTKII